MAHISNFFKNWNMSNFLKKMAGMVLGILVFNAMTLVTITLGPSAVNNINNFLGNNYYFIEPNPVTINLKEVTPCTTIKYKGTNHSTIDSSSFFAVDLFRITDSKASKIATSSTGIWNIQKGISSFELEYTLPCGLLDGEYFLSAVVPYRDESNALKTYPWTSEIITIKNEQTETNKIN